MSIRKSPDFCPDFAKFSPDFPKSGKSRVDFRDPQIWKKNPKGFLLSPTQQEGEQNGEHFQQGK
jgi:hypothetical protein